MELKVGQALASVVDETNVIVTRTDDGPAAITCGGLAMVAKDDPAAGAGMKAEPGHMAGSLLGKRYVNEAGTIELLCTKAGPASLAVDGELLVTAEAKALPSSD